ncbi:MAG: hypothetical protein K1X88_17310 [Nannocystaceae bacterium]|nr:hypothetical protein [Nannocystaceae bacterium]
MVRARLAPGCLALAALISTACGSDSNAGEASSAGSSGGSEGMTTTAEASATGADSTTTNGLERYHPLGYHEAGMHGPDMKLQAEDCRECHGDDLAGGTSEVSCDACHTAGWRTDCVFCHGGELDQTGAPPRDITGTTELSMLSFIAHPKHVAESNHPAYDCTQCHTKPMDVLSSGHIFDGTAAVAEVSFAMSLSDAGVWDGSGNCSSLYCHGNGRQDDGTASHDMATPSCGGCHAYPGTENSNTNALSGRHGEHIADQGLSCQDCHADTDAGGSIVTATLHVDGSPQVKLAGDAAVLMWDPVAKTCLGSCHGAEETRIHTAEDNWFNL